MTPTDDINEAAPEEDALADFPRDSRPWLDLIKDGERSFSTYQEKCDSIDKLYAHLAGMAEVKADRQFQIFWANLEVLKPSIYARAPMPVVVPRFKDTKELPRKASEILERTLSTTFDVEDIDSTMRHVRDDMAINSRGASWLRYEAEEIEDGSIKEKVCFDHIDRKDFLHEPARKWAEVGWVARRAWLSRDEGRKRFGDVFLKVQMQKRKDLEGQDYEGEKKGQVWEIWSKTKGVVVWVTPDLQEILDVKEPFLKLEGFFPCPRPAYGTLQRGSLIPVPDFLYYRDQVEEINELTARISALCESLRMKGFYAAGAEDMSSAIERAMKDQDNSAILTPVPTFALMAGQSMKDAIQWLPVSDIATVVRELIGLRKQLIEDVYQITGISDIMRGDTNASETLGAQQLKSQYGSIRIRDRQNEMIRIARDLTRMAGEIIAENFQPQTLMQMSQVELPTDQQVKQQMMAMQQQAQQAAMMAQQQGQQPPPPPEMPKPPVTIENVIQLFRAEHIRPFVLDIETDSTISPDEDAEKQRATELLTGIGGYMQQAMPLAQMVPEAADMIGQMLIMTVQKYRAGRQIEGVVEDFIEKMKKKAQQPPQPNPEMEKAKMEMQSAQQMAQANLQIKQMDGQIKALDLQIKQIDAQARMAEAQASTMQPGEPTEPFAPDQAMADVRKTVAETEKLQAETDKIRGEAAVAPIKAAQDIDHSERNMELAEKPEPVGAE